MLPSFLGLSPSFFAIWIISFDKRYRFLTSAQIASLFLFKITNSLYLYQVEGIMITILTQSDYLTHAACMGGFLSVLLHQFIDLFFKKSNTHCRFSPAIACFVLKRTLILKFFRRDNVIRIVFCIVHNDEKTCWIFATIAAFLHQGLAYLPHHGLFAEQ